MVPVAYLSKIWPQYEAFLKQQLNISSDDYCQSLTAIYDNASSMQMTLYWIRII